MIYPCLRQTVYAPAGASAADVLPLIVYLRPKETDIPAVLTAGMVQARILCLTCPEELHWQSVLYEIEDAVEETKAAYGVDACRVSVIGEGFGVWAYAIYARKRLSCAVPIAGGGMSWRAHEVKKLPVWAFHGAADTAVNRIHSQEMIERILFSEGHSHMTLYPELGHDILGEVFKDTAVLAWMIARSSDEEFTDDKFVLHTEVKG